MYIKLKDGSIEQYPYSIAQLFSDNPDTSFPDIPTNELLSEWGVYLVTEVSQPIVDYTKNVTEGTPKNIDDVWTQVWVVTDKTPEEISQIASQLRIDAYRNESDPLFFKFQRGEVDKQVWLDKVAEIKARYV